MTKPIKAIQAQFISSVTSLEQCPKTDKPEFAFIGRSNVGKSSLINLLVQRKGLAKISSTPGKTQTINHYLVNDLWYLVDLPGYGYAHVSKGTSKGWNSMIKNYVSKRQTLYCLFILIDSRLEPQPIDIEFINWAGGQGIPICIVFTKVDKLAKSKLFEHVKRFEKKMLETWDELPPLIATSSSAQTGRQEVLDFINTALTK